MARSSLMVLTTGVGTSTENPLPVTGPPSPWIETAASDPAALPMAARVLTHGPDPGVGGTGQDHRGPAGIEEGGQPGGHVEVEGVLGVAGGVLGARRVAGLGESAAVDGPVDEPGIGPVAAVVARIDGHHFADQRRHVDRAQVGGAAEVVDGPVGQTIR